MPTPSRLERALDLFLQCENKTAERDRVLAEHPDLRDLLEPLLQPDATVPAVELLSLGDFELLREVGRGGMGVVYEARQRSLGRRVALKILTPGFEADPTRLSRFRREAVLLGRMEHPHIVAVFDTGEDQGRHWLAMEFVAGETLQQRLDRLRQEGGHRGSSLRALLEIVLAMADALQHVHGQGILHRDVKPANVLLAADGRVLLSDFGLARDERAPTLTSAGIIAGTPNWLAPEYLTQGTMSPAADIWALGVVLYEAITLRRPFDGPTDEVVLQRVVHRDPDDPRRLQPGLHRDLAAIALLALEKRPQTRYPTMAAFADDLRAFLELRPTVARPPSHTQRLRRWIRRQPLRAALAATVTLALGLGGYLLIRLPLLRAGARAEHAAAYEDAIAEGFLRRENANRELAEAAARRALELRPDAGEAIVVAALVRMRFAGPQAGLEELDRLAAGANDDPQACQRLRALILGRLGRADERQALLQRLDEPRSQMDMLLAAGLRLEPPTPEGIQQARELVSVATRSAPPRLLVHAQWATLAAPEDRAECAATLLRLWPEQPFALHLAAVAVQWSSAARALDLQQKALRLGLRDSFAEYNLAMYASKAGEAAVAVATAKKAMADPQLAEERRPALVQVLTDHAPDDVDSAIATWLQLFPGSALARREQARARSVAGDHDAAIAALTELAAAQPDDIEVLFLLAWAQQNAAAWDNALATATQLIAREPAASRGHALLLRACDALPERRAELLHELRRWTAIAPDSGDTWHELATALAAGNTAERAEALQAAMQADAAHRGQDRPTLELLVRLHEQTGATAAAAAVRARLAALPADETGR